MIFIAATVYFALVFIWALHPQLFPQRFFSPPLFSLHFFSRVLCFLSGPLKVAVVPACASFSCHHLSLKLVRGLSSVCSFINFIFESFPLIFFARLVSFQFNHNHIECFGIWFEWLEPCLLRSVLYFFFFFFLWNRCWDPFQRNVKQISTFVSLIFLFFNETDVEIRFKIF